MPSTPTIESGVGTRAIRHTIRCTLSEINELVPEWRAFTAICLTYAYLRCRNVRR